MSLHTCTYCGFKYPIDSKFGIGFLCGSATATIIMPLVWHLLSV